MGAAPAPAPYSNTRVYNQASCSLGGWPQEPRPSRAQAASPLLVTGRGRASKHGKDPHVQMAILSVMPSSLLAINCMLPGAYSLAAGGLACYPPRRCRSWSAHIGSDVYNGARGEPCQWHATKDSFDFYAPWYHKIKGVAYTPRVWWLRNQWCVLFENATSGNKEKNLNHKIEKDALVHKLRDKST